GTTVPHTAKSGVPPLTRSTIACATGTDSSIASSLLSAPSTLAKGVRTPQASQTSVTELELCMGDSCCDGWKSTQGAPAAAGFSIPLWYPPGFSFADKSLAVAG